MTRNQKFLKYLPAVATCISVVSIPYQFAVSSWLEMLWGLKDGAGSNYGWEALGAITLSYTIAFYAVYAWMAPDEKKDTRPDNPNYKFRLEADD